MHRVEPLFKFRSLAVVGASESGGYAPRSYRGLQELGFAGQYFPVNPRREQVFGLRAYPDPASLPENVDAVLVIVPRDHVLPAVRGCADRGAKAVVIISAGFVEQDEHGRALQAELSALARERDLLVVGPNCFGVASLAHRCAAFVGDLGDARVGNVAVISNSGGILNEILSYGNGRGIGFSHLASTGNEAGLTAADLLDYFVDDPATDVVLAVLETVRDPALFVAAAERAVAARKPVVILKLGTSAKGAAGALTHTGALAGSDAVYRALFRQKGITRVDDLDDLVEMGALLSGAVPVLRRRPLERAAIVEISGGGKELVADTAAAAGVDLPDPSPAAVAVLQPGLPANTVASNPLDTGGSWGSPWMDELYPLALRAFAAEPEVDVVISRYSIPRTGELGVLRRRLDELKAARAEHADRLFVVLSRTSDQVSDAWAKAVREEDLVFVQGYGRGMQALGRLAAYSRYLRRHGAAGVQRPRLETAPPLAAAHGVLNEVEAKNLLRAAGLPVIATAWARTAGEAVVAAEDLGYPATVKVVSPQILHKSDVGGVRHNLMDAGAVTQAFVELRAVAEGVPGAEFQGVAVQPTAVPALELALGAHRDPQFGPVILFGLGGVFVEVLHDVALRVAPLSAVDAEEMLDEIQGRALLAGARGQAPADRAALVDALLRLSDLMVSQPALASVDLNPVFSYPERLLAVDARIVLA